jgi:predicted metal-dependent hydrolase
MPPPITPPPLFAEAIRQFNQWRFYDCHETLEDIWRETGAKGDETTLANFYQGLIKAAAGYHHLLRGNHPGVMRVLGDVPRLLDPYRPRTLGVDVDALLAAVAATLASIETLGPTRIAEYDRSGIPQIAWDETPTASPDAPLRSP